MIINADYMGNPFLGLYISTNNQFTFVPRDTPDSLVSKIKETLDTDVVKTAIYNSNLIGLFSAMNDKVLVLPDVAYNDEVNILSEYFDEIISLSGSTAVGNLITMNDNRMVVSPIIGDSSIQHMSDFGMDIYVTKIGNMDVTGSLALLTDHGYLFGSVISDKELNDLSAFLGTDGAVTTVNYGIPMVKSGVVANNSGALVGSLTTPFEMGRIDEGLFLR